MLDLLAAISSVDPTALLAWLVFLFAASGYPLGIMLGSNCSPCCEVNPCTQCHQGFLPDTLTVSFSGLIDQTPGPDLCLLSFSAPYGSGAAGKVTAPGGDPDTDKGPITAVSLTNGGSGYAKLGRVTPTITASGGSGTGATFSVSTTSANDANGIPSWSVTGVTITGIPTGYADGDQITFSVAEGDTEEQAAAATINTTRSSPTLSASASTGTGANFSISYTANGGSPATWGVAGVTVTAGGTGYTDGSTLTLTLGSGDKVDSQAYATILTNRLQPTLSASVTSDNGSGASLSVSLTQTTDYDGRTVWNVSGITATSGGSDYVAGDSVAVAVTDGQEPYNSYFFAHVSSVNGGGAITGITIDFGGEYFKDGGVIQSVAVNDGGYYYKDDGVITGVTVDAGGTYYREDASTSPYVATVTVGLTQTPPSYGTGATLTAIVNSSTASVNFGKITAVTIGSGGTNYLAFALRNTKCCGDYYNGMSVVVKRLNYGDADACVYRHRLCGVGNLLSTFGLVEVRYRGSSLPPTVALFSELHSSGQNSTSCTTGFEAIVNVTDCSDWSSVVCYATGTATATVTAGGEYDDAYRNPGYPSCHICCKGDEEMPLELSVDVNDTAPTNLDFTGTYVLNWSSNWAGGFGTLLGGFSDSAFYMAITPTLCSGQNSQGFFPDYPYGDCDNCHKKCVYVVQILTGVNIAWLDVWQPSCGDCEETPMCTPSGRTFTLTDANQTNSRFVVTVD